jgi:hypothetical protein
MKFLRILLLLLGGATAMALSLLWVAQFFSGFGEGTPVIWIDDSPNKVKEEESFAEWQQDSK